MAAIAKSWQNRIIGSGTEAPDQLLANPLNWRTHPEAQQKALSGVLDEVGWVQQIVVNQRTGNMIDGHLRVTLALRRDEPTVPVLYVDLSAEEEALILATLDPIGALATADKGKLDELLRDVATGDAAVQAMLAELAAESGLDYFGGDEPAEAPEPQIDRAAELQEQWQTERGQLWVIPSLTVPGREHRLLCGDSTKAEDVARLMGGERADALLTDPPYGMKLDARFIYSKGNIDMGIKATKGYANVIGDDGPFDASALLHLWPAPETFLFGADYYVDTLPEYGKAGAWLVWDKKNEDLRNVLGLADFELLWSVQKHKRRVYAVLWNGALGTESEDTKCRVHPTQKPTRLLGRIMDDHLGKGALIADAYVGSGTTMVAAEQTGRVCYGMDIEPKYIAVALQRMADMGLKPRLSDG